MAEMSAEHAAGLDETHFVFLDVVIKEAALIEKVIFCFLELFLT